MMKKNILIIEKDIENVLYYKKLLINAGYKVQHISSDIQLLRYDFTLPDLFVINSRFLTLSETEICQHLKNNPQTKDIPVVIASSDTTTKSACEAAFIEKPLAPEDLLAAIKRLLK